MAAGSQNRQLLHESLPVNLAMVASPSALIPSRTNTFFTVRNRILISNHSERLSIYHTSSLNFSSQLSELRPLTCAQPVTPGRTSWRRYCSVEYKGRYSINNGRGPTKLISPLSTFHKPGNSSKLLERRKLPKGVIRSESGNGLPLASTASRMVRNLIISKGLPPLPGRT